MKVCASCVLPETFPGIRFDAGGVCNHCRSFAGRKEKHDAEKARYRQKFLDVLGQCKKASRRSHDVIMAYSGGKDSSFTLKLLKEQYGLNVLAITFNHGFVSPQALRNIQRVTETLNVDHIMMTPGRETLCRAFTRTLESDVYPLKSLERASSICTTCMNLVKSFVIKTAVEQGVPVIAYGWSPGQAPMASSVLRLNPSMVKQMQETLVRTLGTIMGDDLAPYLLDQERYDKRASGETLPDGESVMYAVHPLAFIDYREEEIMSEIRMLGWEAPQDTDANSTNCLLNAFANRVHLTRHGFHPYAFEIAGLVREGCMSREDGLAKLSAAPDAEVIKSVQKRLGLPENYNFCQEVDS
jgi:tRNA(Ile)-lysidine synthase TilS/MesJ